MKEIAIVKIILSVLFLICLVDMPYGYFQFVRFIGMIGFGYLAYNESQLKNSNWTLFYIASSVLINPIIKISLGRELWNVIDIIWAIVLIATLLNTKVKKSR